MISSDVAKQRKKPGPKPKQDAEVAVAVDVAENAPVEVAAPVAVEAPEDRDEPSHPESGMPLIDGKDPQWAVNCVVGARHIQFTAADSVSHTDLVGQLNAGTIRLPGDTVDTLIASRSMTPPTLHPVRVTFTVRENLNR